MYICVCNPNNAFIFSYIPSIHLAIEIQLLLWYMPLSKTTFSWDDQVKVKGLALEPNSDFGL